ncbi:MAG: HAMP domain-containing histidine kinase [Ignavibacteria bacterium]|nr:HAMP domain-containing histidine kinase [Ignavibacteria bacterium]
MSDYYIYVIGLIPIFLLFMIVLHFLNKKRQRELASQESSHLHNTHNTAEGRAFRTTNQGENAEVARLRQEIADLQRKNGRLKDQIDELRGNVTKLEEANLQLNAQKERLEKSKEKLVDLQKRKEELFAIAVHDIKNPAGALKGYVDLLKSYDLNAVEQQELLEFVSSASMRIVEIAQKISLAVAKEEQFDTISLHKSNLKRLIDHVCKENDAYASKKNIKLVNQSSPDIPEIMIDEFKIQEVLENLINNAIKFGPDGTIVQIRTYFNQENVVIEIVDNGVGMSTEDLTKVFKKGVTLSARPTGGEPSSGLGLWIVKKIVEDHAGKINVQSKSGAGTKFTITLPVSSN